MKYLYLLLFIGFIFLLNGLTSEVEEIKEKYNDHNGGTIEEQLEKYN